MFKIGIFVLNYLDDLASAETLDNASFAFDTLGTILEKCGIEESKNQVLSTYCIMTLIGVLFKSNRKAMNRNWSNQKANPSLKTKAGNK